MHRRNLNVSFQCNGLDSNQLLLAGDTRPFSMTTLQWAAPRASHQAQSSIMHPLLHMWMHDLGTGLVDMVSSEDSLRSSRNSVQALLESRYCIQSTRFNNTRDLHMCMGRYEQKQPLKRRIPASAQLRSSVDSSRP